MRSQAAPLVVAEGLRGQDHHRDVHRGRILLEPRQHVEAGHPGHHEVEHDGVGALRPRVAQPFHRADRLPDVEGGAGQMVADEVAGDLVVVDHEHAPAALPLEQPVQGAEQPGRVHRLDRVGVGPQGQALRLIVDAGHHDDRHGAGVVAAPHLADERPGVLALEANVEHHRDRMELVDEPPRVREGAGRHRLEGRVAEVVLVEQQILGAVLHHQHRPRPGSIAPAGSAGVDAPGLGLDRVPHRDRRGERGADPRGALQRDAAAEQRGEPPHQRQAEPGAAHAALHRVLELAELLEDALLVLGRDADAGVGHRERDRVVAGRPRAHPDLAALGELERVREQVAQDLRDLALVGVHQGQPVRLLEDQVDRLVQEQRPQHAAERGEEVPDVEVGGADHRSCPPRPWRGRAGRSPAR